MLHEVGITVEEVLGLAEFADVKVIGGSQGLGRVITNVNVMEVPDILEWVREGDLLLTTGYPIKDDVEAQRSLLPKLAARGLAAIALKPKRYIDSVPVHMVEAANEHGLPLLELPLEANFSELISAVLAQIVNRQAKFVQLGMAVHRKFINLILEGGGLEEIAGALADLLKAVVLVEDFLNLRRTLAGKCWGRGDDALVPTLFDRPAEFLATETFTDSIEGTVLSFQREQVEGEGYRVEIIKVPVMTGNEEIGYIKAVKFASGFSVLDLLNLERLCPLLSLDIIRQHGIAQVEQKYRTEFLDQLFSAEHPDEERFAARGKTFGWDLNLQYVAVLFDVLPTRRIDNIAENERACQLVKTQAMTILSDFCRRNKLRHILTSHASGILLFLHPGEGLQHAEVTPWVDDVVKRARKNLQRWVVTTGISRPGRGAGGLKRGYHEARVALELGKVISGPGHDIHYETLGIYGLLLGQASLDEQKRFAADVVNPLRSYDASRGGELLKTLETYLQSNGNAKRTATLLFTHYNTVLYRLNKIRQLTGLDPYHPDQRVTLQAALRLFRVFDAGHAAS
ncbi:MAG: PucR family transcriptional regulator [Bacillota bacterium]